MPDRYLKQRLGLNFFFVDCKHKTVGINVAFLSIQVLLTSVVHDCRNFKKCTKVW